LQRYGDLTVFKMAAVHHLDFLNSNFLTVTVVERPILHCTKFREDQSNHCGSFAIFVIFKMAAAAILDFQKFEILMVNLLLWGNMRHSAKFHQNRSSSCRDMVI